MRHAVFRAWRLFFIRLALIAVATGAAWLHQQHVADAAQRQSLSAGSDRTDLHPARRRSLDMDNDGALEL